MADFARQEYTLGEGFLPQEAQRQHELDGALFNLLRESGVTQRLQWIARGGGEGRRIHLATGGFIDMGDSIQTLTPCEFTDLPMSEILARVRHAMDQQH